MTDHYTNPIPSALSLLRRELARRRAVHSIQVSEGIFGPVGFEISAPAPSKAAVADILGDVLEHYGPGRFSVVAYEASPGAVGAGWTVRVTLSEDGEGSSGLDYWADGDDSAVALYDDAVYEGVGEVLSSIGKGVVGVGRGIGKGTVAVARGAGKTAQVIGKGAKVVGRGIGKTAQVVGRGAKKVGQGVGKGVKSVTTTVAQGAPRRQARRQRRRSVLGKGAKALSQGSSRRQERREGLWSRLGERSSSGEGRRSGRRGLRKERRLSRGAADAAVLIAAQKAMRPQSSLPDLPRPPARPSPDRYARIERLVERINWLESAGYERDSARYAASLYLAVAHSEPRVASALRAFLDGRTRYVILA